MILNVLLVFVIVCLTIMLYYSLKKNAQAGQQLIEYDEFFNASLNDVQEVIDYLEKLSKRELVSQDPDVINLKKTIVILRDVLRGYAQGKYFYEETAKKE
jgi:small nuclear ribonucleoprotein (snRNP)-like protein